MLSIIIKQLKPASTMQNLQMTGTGQQQNPQSYVEAEQGIQMPMLEDIDDSTHQSELLHDQMELNHVYILHIHILEGTRITENMRARIRFFLMKEASNQFLYRDTCVLACIYLDLYFLNHGTVEVNDFQSLAIGCLILASKINQGKLPTIHFNIFSRQQLLMYQKRVAKRLNYFLNPITYDQYSERVVALWERFTETEQLYNIPFNKQEEGVNIKLRTFHEQLDCVYLVLKSLDYPPEVLTVNLFYLNAVKLNHPQIVAARNLTDLQFVEIYYSPNRPFHQFFQRFLPFYSRKEITLDIQLGKFLKYFLDVVPANNKWLVSGTAEVVEKFRVFDRLQSLPKECYVLAKSVISKMRR